MERRDDTDGDRLRTGDVVTGGRGTRPSRVVACGVVAGRNEP